MKINVLDKGYVLYKDHMGNDLSVVNDAKVSFDKESTEFGDGEARLVNFLGREHHTSPFRGSIIKFEVYAPLMVARQWWKYVVGSDHTMDAWNESSRRYITENVEFYIPGRDGWRTAPENKKQGSGEALDGVFGSNFTWKLIERCQQAETDYEDAIEAGICVEQARLFLLAYGLYVRWRWTASLNSVLHFLDQRLAHDAQAEIQQFAAAVEGITLKFFPNATKAWRNAEI